MAGISVYERVVAEIAVPWAGWVIRDTIILSCIGARCAASKRSNIQSCRSVDAKSNLAWHIILLIQNYQDQCE